MKKILKKGFTIVELVIVIAVIAILTAVLVPTISSVVRKAQVSSDTQLVRNLNTALKEDEALNGKPATMQGALDVAAADGYDVAKINAKARDNEILWDSVNNVFAYIKDGAIEYIPNSVKENAKLLADDYRLWVISNKVSTTYSTYYTGTESAITTSKGFDAGKNTGITSITYENTGVKKDVVIRTNGGTLTIDAQNENDVVRHYGNAQIVTLKSIGTHSYYEHGSTNLVDIKKGRLVLTNDSEAEVGTVYLTATNDGYDGIILATQSGAELPDVVARENVTVPTTGEKLVVTIQTNVDTKGENPTKTEEIKLYPASDVKEATNGYNVSDLGLLVVEALSESGKAEAAEQISDPEVRASVEETKVEDSEVITTGATLFNGGNGSEKNPFVISTAESLLNIGKGLPTGATANYILSNDIVLADEMRTFDDAYGYYNIVEDKTQDIHLDLNKHAISNINASVFDALYHIEVFNGKLVFDANTKDATLVEVIRHKDESASAYFHDIAIEGTALINEDHWGPLVSYMYGCNTNSSTISADKILVNLTVKNSLNDSYSGGLFGYIQGSKISASVTNCQVNGSIQGPYAYGFFNGCSYPEGAVVVNSGNVLYGSLLGSKGVGIFGLNGNYNPSTDTPAKQDALVANYGQMATVSSSNTLIENSTSMSIGDQIVLNNTNSNVSYITVSIVYWTNRASDGTGGYPNNIDVRIEVNGEIGTFESGLYMNKIVQASSRHSGDSLVDESYRQIWKDGNNYRVYQEDAVFSSSKAQIHVYAYNESGTMITYQSMQYNVK